MSTRLRQAGGRLLLLALMLAAWAGAARAAPAAAGCPDGERPFPTFYADAEPFARGIAGANLLEPSNRRLSGIIVPHHLLAPELVALGFRAASASHYRRIVILSPDHFRATTKPVAVTGRGFDTVLGPVPGDAAFAAALEGGDLVEDSCLFARDHGVAALLPFVRHYFPGVPVVALAISVRSGRRDWEALADRLAPLIDADTLVVESTDFSHYLPPGDAARHDQQTLNVMAGGSLDQIARLRQPEHADSVGALYVQMKLQQRVFGATPLVIANENSDSRSAVPTSSTTSYLVTLFGRFDEGFNAPARPSDRIYLLGGDVFFGRAMVPALLDEAGAARLLDTVKGLTRGRPLIVNLEGVILPDVPAGLPELTLVMPERLAADWLRRLGVVAVGLANNHAHDLGESGLAETRRALAAAGIPSFGQGERLSLPGLDLVGLTDLDSTGDRKTGLIDERLLGALSAPSTTGLTAAFVHWGDEYRDEPGPRETALTEAMRLSGVPLIVGAHPHVAGAGIEALAGGDTLLAYSLGNFLFDQGASRSSGALLELRLFGQGTFFGRWIPIPPLYERLVGKRS